MHKKTVINNEKTFHKTKLLLKIYRDVVWSIEDRISEVEEEYCDMGSRRLKNMLDFLDDYDIDGNKRLFEEKLSCILTSKWLIEIVDKALMKVKNYPDYGEMYFNILYKQYILKYKYRETELIEALNVERTTFYKRKKEAINLMGISIWGYVIPSLRELYCPKQEVNKIST